MMKCLVCKDESERELCQTCAKILKMKYPEQSLWDIIERYEKYANGDEEE